MLKMPAKTGRQLARESIPVSDELGKKKGGEKEKEEKGVT